jgi:N utilization substance protein B
MLKIILECACFEIISSLDLHAKIILNEYVNIASSYFSQKETVFVNGVLNSTARKYRPESFSEN